MLKTQKLLLITGAILFLALTLILVIQNMAVDVPVQFLIWTAPRFSLGLLMAGASLLLGTAIMLKMWERVLILGTQEKKVSRELERKEVSREEASEKVKALENKIITLEKALSQALGMNMPQ